MSNAARKTVKIDVRAVWNLFIVAWACAIAALPIPAHLVERWYSSGIYPPLQRLVTSTSNLVPFALLDVALAVLALTWIWQSVWDIYRSTHKPRTILRRVWGSLTAAAVIYLIFLILWGLNYRRMPLDQKLPYDSGAVTADAARDAASLTIRRLNALFDIAHGRIGDEKATTGELANGFGAAIKELGVTSTTVPGRPKRTILDVYFRAAGVAGMTDPFFLETLVQSDLLPVERPFVIAHEWGHLAGFADEGEANFAGWLACLRGGAAAQYSGWLFLFGELMNSVSHEDRVVLIGRLASGPRSDLRAIAARQARDLKPQVSEAGWRVYDHYLKANRVSSGAASYAQVVRLVLGTRIGLNESGAASPAR